MAYLGAKLLNERNDSRIVDDLWSPISNPVRADDHSRELLRSPMATQNDDLFVAIAPLSGKTKNLCPRGEVLRSRPDLRLTWTIRNSVLDVPDKTPLRWQLRLGQDAP